MPKDRADPTATHVARVRRAHRMAVADHVKVPPRCAAISATAEAHRLPPRPVRPALCHHPLRHSVTRRYSSDAHVVGGSISPTLARHRSRLRAASRVSPAAAAVATRYPVPPDPLAAARPPGQNSIAIAPLSTGGTIRSRGPTSTGSPTRPGRRRRHLHTVNLHLPCALPLARRSLHSVSASAQPCSRATSQTNQTQPRLRRLRRLPACRSDRSSAPESFPAAVSVVAVACRDKRIGTDSQTFISKLRERREGQRHSRNHQRTNPPSYAVRKSRLAPP
jgi:hypothetical protein